MKYVGNKILLGNAYNKKTDTRRDFDPSELLNKIIHILKEIMLYIRQIGIWITFCYEIS